MLVLVLGVAVPALGPGAAGAAPAAPPVSARTYRPPVDAPVSDPFRPPPQPWLPGNRGIEYATVPGSVIGAIGPGIVVFAGSVAGDLDVTVRHPDGLRSSYVHLAAIRVRSGDAVVGGEGIGIAGPVFHVGVRRGDTYLDPASLWGRAVGGGRAVLVPTGRRSAPVPGQDPALGETPLTSHPRLTRPTPAAAVDPASSRVPRPTPPPAEVSVRRSAAEASDLVSRAFLGVWGVGR